MIVKTNDQYYKDIANAIRQKNGSESTYKPSEMAAAIESIPGTEMEDLLVERPSTFTNYRNDRVTSVGAYAFYWSNISNFYLPLCEVLGTSAFNHAVPETFYFKSVTSILSSVFSYCENLKWVAFEKTVSLGGGGCFSYSNNLVAAIFLGNEVSILKNASNFTRTQIESGTGYIYVPDSLLEQYKVATNWSVYAEQIKPISELPHEIQAWLDEQEAMVA